MVSKIDEYFKQNEYFWNVSDQEWELNRNLLLIKFEANNLKISPDALDALRREAIKQKKKKSFKEYHDPDNSHVFSNEFDGFYSVRDDGVFFYKVGEPNGLKICDYLIVTELFTTDKRQVGRGLTWRNEYSGEMVSRFFFNDEIFDIKNLTKELTLYGLNVYTFSNKRNYLYDYIKSCLPEKRSFMVTQPGWVSLDKKQYAYVRPGFIAGRQRIPLIAPDSFKENCKQSGSLSDWQERIGKPALSSSRAVFACATVLASTCLKFMGDVRLRVGFNFVGSSTSGKTLAMKIGLSVAGNPQTLTHTWWGNNNGLSALVKEHNDFVCALDEMSTLSKKEEAVDIAYILLGGQEKNRANTVGTRLKESNSEWNVLLLSTGEEGLLSLAKKSGKDINTGAELRILDIPLSASGKYGVNEYLPEGFKSIQDYGQEMNDCIHQYYGVIFQLFIGRLCNRLNDPNNPNTVGDFVKTVKRFAKKFVEKYAKNKTAQVQKAAYCFGFVAAIGDMACGGSDGYITPKSIFGWDCSTADSIGAVEIAAYQCFKDWLIEFEADKIAGDFCIEESDDKETQKILKRTYDLFDSRISSFANVNMDSESCSRFFKSNELLGFYEDVKINKNDSSSELEQQRIFYLITQSFDKYIQSGSNRAKVINILNEKKIINQKIAKPKRIKCQNRLVKVWTFVLP